MEENEASPGALEAAEQTDRPGIPGPSNPESTPAPVIPGSHPHPHIHHHHHHHPIHHGRSFRFHFHAPGHGHAHSHAPDPGLARLDAQQPAGVQNTPVGAVPLQGAAANPALVSAFLSLPVYLRTVLLITCIHK